MSNNNMNMTYSTEYEYGNIPALKNPLSIEGSV